MRLDAFAPLQDGGPHSKRPTERAENWLPWQVDSSFDNLGQVALLYFVNM